MKNQQKSISSRNEISASNKWGFRYLSRPNKVKFDKNWKQAYQKIVKKIKEYLQFHERLHESVPQFIDTYNNVRTR